MKKVTAITIIVLTLFCFATTLTGKNYKAPKLVEVQKNNIPVSVLPQVEIISIIQTISNYKSTHGFLMAKDSFDYKKEVILHFSPYKNHPAIRMFNRLSSKPGMLNFSAPSSIMLYTDNHLQLRKDIELDPFIVNRTGGRDTLISFLNEVRDFAIQSSFNEFYRKQRGYYQEIIQNTINQLGEHDYITEIETFYGQKQNSYNINLVSLYSFVGFGNSIRYANGKSDIFNVMGPMKIKNDVPFFGDTNYLKYMIRHEFSHPYINPLTEKYWDYINSYSSNYSLIPEIAKKKVCGDWQECINEFVIRAITTHLAKNESEELRKWAYNKEKSKGVSYLDDLLSKIEVYQGNRETYSDFESYYYHILDVFKEK